MYFDGRISRSLGSLFLGRALLQVGGGLLSIFLPIFLFEFLNQNLAYLSLYYLIGFVSYGLLVTAGARFLNSFGFKRSLQLSVIWGALFYVVFYFINPENLIYLLPLTILTAVLFRIFHWLPYHVDFAAFTDKENRGREVGALKAGVTIIGVLMPLVAGFVITKSGFGILFIIAAVTFAMSLIPFGRMNKVKEKFSWGYWQTWKIFFAKENRKTHFAFFAFGAESIVGLIIWPIFIFQLLKGNYLDIGIISALVLGVTVLFQLLVGKFADKNMPKHKILKFGSILYAIGWVFKIFIATAFQIFIVDFYHKVTRVFTSVSYDSLTYDIAADQGHYVDEFTVLREIAIQFGKSAMLIVVIIAAPLIPLSWIFILAAIASVFLNLLTPGFKILRSRFD